MAGTNPNDVVDDDAITTEDDLRRLKYPDEDVDPPVEDEPSDDADPADDPDEVIEDDDKIIDPEAEDEETPPAFVKEFDYIKGDTPEEYARNMDAAYKNSTAEALRLKAELEKTAQAPPVTQAAPAEDEDPVPKSATDLYVQQKLDEEIQTAFEQTRKDYPQVNDLAEYNKFTKEVDLFARAAIAKGRLAPPAELYNKAAISLGWEKHTAEPDSKEKLAMAAKDGAASSKATAGPAKPQPAKPKISEAQLKLNRKMYPGKTDQEIIDELTPYLQH